MISAYESKQIAGAMDRIRLLEEQVAELQRLCNELAAEFAAVRAEQSPETKGEK